MTTFAAEKYPDAIIQPRCNLSISSPSSQLEVAKAIVVLGENLQNIGRHYRAVGVMVHLFEQPAEDEGKETAGTNLKAENILTADQDKTQDEPPKSEVTKVPVGGRKPPQAAKGKQAKQKQGE